MGTVVPGFPSRPNNFQNLKDVHLTSVSFLKVRDPLLEALPKVDILLPITSPKGITHVTLNKPPGKENKTSRSGLALSGFIPGTGERAT